MIVTQDALVEDVHFRLDWISWRDLGWRAAAVNLSDLAASGADAEGLLVTLAAPGEVQVEDVVELYEGIAETGVPVARRRYLEGTQHHAQRYGDRAFGPGSGPSRGDPRRPGGRDRTARRGGCRVPARVYARPPLRLTEGKQLGAHAHAVLDISDGLAVDAGHIASRSGCRVVIELERVPLAAGAELSDLGFGEDYELLAAVESPSGHTIIGHCEEGTGVELTLNGEPYELGGWQHFR